MDCRSPPAFYNILLDPSAHHMRLPPNFVSKHLKKKIPANPILLRCVNSTSISSWKLNLKQVDADYCFTQGWNNVVNDMQLAFGDFLLFRLVDHSTFTVLVYSPDGCEKHFISKTQQPHDDDEDHKEEDDDPFFTTVITKTHKTQLRIPAEFTELVGKGGERRIGLKDPNGKEWRLGLRLDKPYLRFERYSVSSGWCGFRRGNQLSEGDECVFKFSRNEGMLCLVKVTRTKEPTGQVEVVRKRGRVHEVVKRPRGRPLKSKANVG